MRRLFNYIMAFTFLFVIFSTAVLAQKSVSPDIDIPALMTKAQETFDLQKEDAVLLFDGQKVRQHADGRITHFVHRVIWINTDQAIESYGDHRITFDSENRKFNVVTVRTWRDNEWWQTGETGIVETLPYAVRKAYDYTNLRDMMLLHDGIELPCILEVAYYIEDKEPYRAGADGIWIFSRPDPAVQSYFSLQVPQGSTPTYFAPESVPQPTKETDTDEKFDIYAWTMGPLQTESYPHTDDPAAYSPHIIWSTWESWNELGGNIKKTFNLMAVTDSLLEKAVDSVIAGTRTRSEAADRIASFINNRTRFIGIDENYWYDNPRQASDIYQSAYGHRLDRAILAAALFRRAGLSTFPVYISKGYNEIKSDIASLDRFTGVGVWISGEDIEGYYDPATGAIYNGFAYLYGRTYWLAGEGEKPAVRIRANNEQSRYYLRLDIKFSNEKDTIHGKGYLNAGNCLNPFDKMEGLSSQTKGFLNSAVSGVIDGAKVEEYNLERFDQFNVTAGFTFKFPKPKKSDYGWLPLILDNPAGGLKENLPNDVNILHAERESPVIFPCLMNFKVELRIDTSGVEFKYLPETKIIENDAGSCLIYSAENFGKQIVACELTLAKTYFEASEWPSLKELLLAYFHERNNTILMVQKDKENK